MDATTVQPLLTVGAGTGARWVPGPQQAPALGSGGGRAQHPHQSCGNHTWLGI